MVQKSSESDVLKESILILAPTGQDAALIHAALSQVQITGEIFRSLPELCERLARDAGALLLAEEALPSSALAQLRTILASQDAWSDIPVIVMTTGGETTLGSLDVLKALLPAGNITLLERPFRQITLIASLQVALRARRRQYQVRELLEKQIEATRLRDEFISIASHELKTPLTSLKLQTDANDRLIRKSGLAEFKPDKVRKLIDTTQRQVGRLTHLVEDMLDVSRIGAGKLSIRASTVDLGELVQDVVDRVLPQALEAGNTVEIKIQPGIVGYWDSFRIEQVVINLLTNAIRYASGKRIWVEVSRIGSEARLSVRDEGQGIPRERQSRIFDRFERAVAASNVSGLGLGLYICREIVKAHGGTIHVESDVDQGATFIVMLPLNPSLTGT